jgi:hypothetical protein
VNGGQGLDVLAVATIGIAVQEIFSRIAEPAGCATCRIDPDRGPRLAA